MTKGFDVPTMPIINSADLRAMTEGETRVFERRSLSDDQNVHSVGCRIGSKFATKVVIVVNPETGEGRKMLFVTRVG